MSIASEIQRLQTDSSAIASAITAKGVTVPSGSGFDDYASLIASISGGGQSYSYATNGLILHLVGEDATSSSWVSRVGNYTFTLENCSLGTNYVQFNGTNSIGYCSSGPKGNINSQTLEVVFNMNGLSSATQVIVGFPPASSGNTGIMLAIQANGTCVRAFAYGNTTVSSCLMLPNGAFSFGDIVSISNYGLNSVRIGNDFASFWTSGGSFYSTNAIPSIGGRRNPNTTLPFAGKIYQVRLYSRILTMEEIITNYFADKQKYGLI